MVLYIRNSKGWHLQTLTNQPGQKSRRSTSEGCSTSSVPTICVNGYESAQKNDKSKTIHFEYNEYFWWRLFLEDSYLSWASSWKLHLDCCIVKHQWVWFSHKRLSCQMVWFSSHKRIYYSAEKEISVQTSNKKHTVFRAPSLHSLLVIDEKKRKQKK